MAEWAAAMQWAGVRSELGVGLREERKRGREAGPRALVRE
jgi:hypothetical protein